MIGGLFRSSSRVAMVAAAGLLSGGVAAQAADLGGNCCADLEERVAELEATTARKGNRRVSLTVTGNISQHVVWWDDGHESNAYVGSDDNRTSRFAFRGNASINSDWSAGFMMRVRVGKATDTSADQNTPPATDQAPFVSDAFVSITSRTWGTIRIGHQSDATDGIRSICLGCTADVSASSTGTTAGTLNAKVNGTAGPTWGSLGTANVADGGRGNLVHYISPSIAGFSVSASWGQDDEYDVALRYAQEFGAFRVAGGIGYAHSTGNGSSTIVTNARESEYVSGSVSVAHVPTGLYVAFAASETENGADLAANAGGAVRDTTDTQWWVGAGIVTKLNSLGNTTLAFGYGQSDEGFVGCTTAQSGGTTNNCTANGLPASTVAWAGAETESFTVGVQQAIDAAAMELYMSYGLMSGDLIAPAGNKVSLDDTQYVQAGMRINF